MNFVIKIFAVLIVALNFAVANANEFEFDPYFDWKIDRPETYKVYESMSADASIKVNLPDEIRNMITSGRYLETVAFCKFFEPYQKVALGADYFDAGLTELVAKLYLETDELDAATIPKL